MNSSLGAASDDDVSLRVCEWYLQTPAFRWCYVNTDLDRE